jgi:hypothetical protein
MQRMEEETRNKKCEIHSVNTASQPASSGGVGDQSTAFANVLFPLSLVSPVFIGFQIFNVKCDSAGHQSS